MRRLLLGLAIALMAGLVPGTADGDDNAIRQHITNTLKMEQQRGNLSGFHLNLRVDQGTVWYEGYVASQAQKMLVLRTAQRAKQLGVVQIVDDIDVRGAATANMQQGNTYMQQAAYTQDNVAPAAPVFQQPAPMMQQQPQPMYRQQPVMQQAPYAGSQVPAQMNAAPMQAQQAPMPISYGGGAGIQADNPSLPGYAWPGYAAHPNYGAVTYPKQYSPSAWPYIGPFYPYPQVPLGWRKVTMEWDDGWWFLDFHNK